MLIHSALEAGRWWGAFLRSFSWGSCQSRSLLQKTASNTNPAKVLHTLKRTRTSQACTTLFHRQLLPERQIITFFFHWKSTKQVKPFISVPKHGTIGQGKTRQFFSHQPKICTHEKMRNTTQLFQVSFQLKVPWGKKILILTIRVEKLFRNLKLTISLSSWQNHDHVDGKHTENY